MIWGRNRKIRSAREWVQDGLRGVAWLGARALRPVALAGGVALLALGTHAGWTRLHQSPMFRLQHLVIEGNHEMSVEEVAAACELEPGITNVILTRGSQVRESCLVDPRIREARVEVEPPSRIRVAIRERVAELYAALPDGLWAVSALGEVFSPVVPEAFRPLPILTGAADLLHDHPEPAPLGPKPTLKDRIAYRNALESRRELDARRSLVLREALSLARVTNRANVPAWRGQALELAHDGIMGFSVRPLAGGMTARFGHAPFGRKATRLMRALVAVEGPTRTVSEAFLDNEARPNEVTVMLRQAPVAAAAGGLEAHP